MMIFTYREFRRWAIMGDWGNAYRTMDAAYEVIQNDNRTLSVIDS
jgi:isoleucyl-tRNA synthetase